MIKVKSLLKKTLKAILWVVGIFILLFIILAILIQFPSIQTRIVQSATSFVSGKTHTRVEIKNVSISFPKTVVLKSLYLEDLQKDTLIYAGETKVNITLSDLLFSKIDVSSFALKDVTLHLNRTSTDSLYNFNFLLKAFADTTKKAVTVPNKPSKWKFNVDKISITDIRIHFDDEYGGINAAVKLKKLKLTVDKIDFLKSNYKIDDLLVDGILGTVRMKESKSKKQINKTGISPAISASTIRIINSTVSYNDLVGKQSVIAAINELDLKTASVDLEKESVSLDRITLSKSKISYHTTESSVIVNKKAEQSNSGKSDWKVDVKNVDMQDNSLSYQVTNKPAIKNAFDANHMYFKYFSLNATDIYYSSAKTRAKILKFNTIDQNKFIITRFETDFSMDRHSITAKKLKIKTTNSSLEADVNLRFMSLDKLKESLPTLFLQVELKKVSVKNADILYFNPLLIKQSFFKNKMNVTTVTGILSGHVNNLNGKNLIVTTGSKTILKTDFNITGLPKAETATYNFPILNVLPADKTLK